MSTVFLHGCQTSCNALIFSRKSRTRTYHRFASIHFDCHPPKKKGVIKKCSLKKSTQKKKNLTENTHKTRGLEHQVAWMEVKSQSKKNNMNCPNSLGKCYLIHQPRFPINFRGFENLSYQNWRSFLGSRVRSPPNSTKQLVTSWGKHYQLCMWRRRWR